MAIPFNQLNPIPFNPEFALFEHVAKQLTKENPNQPFRDLDDLLNATQAASEITELSEVAELTGLGSIRVMHVPPAFNERVSFGAGNCPLLDEDGIFLVALSPNDGRFASDAKGLVCYFLSASSEFFSEHAWQSLAVYKFLLRKAGLLHLYEPAHWLRSCDDSTEAPSNYEIERITDVVASTLPLSMGIGEASSSALRSLRCSLEELEGNVPMATVIVQAGQRSPYLQPQSQGRP